MILKEMSLEQQHKVNLIHGRLITGREFCCSVLWLISGLLMLLQPHPAYSFTDDKHLIDNGGYVVQDGSHLLSFREQDLFTPASTLKILTCLIAFEQLGKDYRFETRFFLDEQKNLYVKGYGDPFLTSEVILEIGKKLAGLGIGHIRSLYLDESSFALEGESASDENSANPYDAPNGALAVNFNALPVQVRKNGVINSGEPQTPPIPLMTEAGNRLPPGKYHVNVNTLPQSDQLPPALRYTGQLFVAQLRRAGISLNKGYHRNKVPEGLKPIYIHYSSKSLEEIVRECLKYSNNYIANQLFLACGAKHFGLPASWEKSRQTFALYTRKTLKLTPHQVFVREGSGLSRDNKISPAALLTILEFFKPHSSLLNLKSKTFIKSGTMKDVYCYAGYFQRETGLTPFVIMLNQPQNNRDPLLNALHAALRSKEITTN